MIRIATDKELSSNRSADRKAQIKKAALERFARNGFHQTKISDIVRDAGVSQGTFYLYFKSKEAVALEIIESGRKQLLEVIAQGYRSGTGTVADMQQASEALLAELFAYARDNRYFMELLLVGAGTDELLRGAIAETRTAMEEAFRRNIERAIELGMLPDTISTDVRAALLMGLIEGIVSRWLFGTSEAHASIAEKSPQELAAATARFEFFGLIGI
ncbi:TetR/AcrR family transcriptional regulator [Paenibacillus thailandensis]|uniref:TetR/AcrR family transcriptional regulator n=1 Tax=Paenibacillus thailandensis TaxID=393250 RepID=A0ABW5QUJ8_9BACL